jgi:hypothetical protein
MKKSAVTLAILVALFTGWYFASPQWSLRQMAAAAEENDTERLSSYIDFPALRESVKAELRAEIAAKLIKETDGMKGFGGLLAMGMVDGMVDAIVTPEMMRNAFASKKSSDRQTSGPFKLDTEGTEFVRDSLDQFRLRHAGRPDLVFGRRGLGWKLVGIRAVSDQRRAAVTTSEPAQEPIENQELEPLASATQGTDTLSQTQQEEFADPCVGHYLSTERGPDEVSYAIDVTNRPLEIAVQFSDFGNIKAVEERAVASGALEFVDYDDKTPYRVTCSGDRITLKSGSQTFVGIKSDEQLQMSEDGE